MNVYEPHHRFSAYNLAHELDVDDPNTDIVFTSSGFNVHNTLDHTVLVSWDRKRVFF